jgi:hypothetical protein
MRDAGRDASGDRPIPAPNDTQRRRAHVIFDEQSDRRVFLQLGGYLVDPVHRPLALRELDWRTNDRSAR